VNSSQQQQQQVVGATLCAALWLVLALVQNASNEHGHVVGWEKVLPVYRLSAMPILCIWFWGLNLLVWERARMNHVAIFDFNPTSALSHTPLFRVLPSSSYSSSVKFQMNPAELCMRDVIVVVPA